MNAEFNWWLLIVGLVIGAGLVYLVLADSRRREVDVLEREREGEALWIAETLADAGRSLPADDVLEILRLHADYLAAGPPDEAFDEELGDGRWTEVGTGRHAVAGRAADPDRALMAHPIARAGDDDGGAA